MCPSDPNPIASLFAALPLLVSGHGRLLVHSELEPDEASLRAELFLDERLAGTLRVDGSRRTMELAVPLRASIQKYRIAAEVVSKDGQRRPVAGAGLVLDEASLKKRLEKSSRDGRLGQEMEAIVREVDAALSRPPGRVRVVAGRPVTESDLAAARERLGVSLPPAYVELLRDLGPFEVRADVPDEGPNAVVVALFHPVDLRSVASWLRDELKAGSPEKHADGRPVDWKALERDVVLAASFSSHWVARVGTHPLSDSKEPAVSCETLTSYAFSEEMGTFAPYFDPTPAPSFSGRWARSFRSFPVVLLQQLGREVSIVVASEETGATLARLPGGSGGLAVALRGPTP